jgi:hypothetical protein
LGWKTKLNCRLMNSRPISSTWNGRWAFTMGCDARSAGFRKSTSATSAPSPVRRKDGRPHKTPVLGLPQRRLMGGDACSPSCRWQCRLQFRCRRRVHARSWRAGPAREIAETTRLVEDVARGCVEAGRCWRMSCGDQSEPASVSASAEAAGHRSRTAAGSHGARGLTACGVAEAHGLRGHGLRRGGRSQRHTMVIGFSLPSLCFPVIRASPRVCQINLASIYF